MKDSCLNSILKYGLSIMSTSCCLYVLIYRLISCCNLFRCSLGLTNAASSPSVRQELWMRTARYTMTQYKGKEGAGRWGQRGLLKDAIYNMPQSF